MALYGADWHRSGALAVPGDMGLLPLPPYSPELNPVENIWEGLREKDVGNGVFDSMADLEGRLQAGLKRLEDHPEITKSISAWPWIIDAITI
jgi:transposase